MTQPLIHRLAAAVSEWADARAGAPMEGASVNV